MIWDKYGFIQMEQTPFPASVGDSCAETARWLILCALLGDMPGIDLSQFVTDKGVLRHPDSPWRENDTSDDQESPLIAITAVQDSSLKDKIINQIRSAGWRTGNGQFIHLSTLGLIRRAQKFHCLWLWDLAILGQALLMKLPYRWNDSKKAFEKSSNSSADYLNFINYLAFAKSQGKLSLPCRLATKVIGISEALQKVHYYYQPEPNNKIILDLYERAAPLIW